MIQLTHLFVPGFVKEGNELSGMAFLKEIIPVDGFLRETHSYSRTTSKYPIQTGASVSDFSKRKQPEVEISCILADSVIGLWNPLTGIIESRPGRKEEMQQKILDLHESDTLFSINTTKGIYDVCLFGNLTFDVEVEDEDTIPFKAKLEINWFASMTEETEEINLADELFGFIGPVKNLGRTTPRPLEII